MELTLKEARLLGQLLAACDDSTKPMFTVDDGETVIDSMVLRRQITPVGWHGRRADDDVRNWYIQLSGASEMQLLISDVLKLMARREFILP